MRELHRMPILSCLVAATLVSCGGGGGGSDGGSGAAPAPPAPATGATVPLALSASNATDAALLAFATGEGLLQLAEHAVELVQRVRGSSQTNLALSCPVAGRVDLVFTDVDGDRQPGGGDSIRVNSSGCQSSALNGRATGEFTITLETPAAGALEAYVGTLRFTQGYRITDGAGADPVDVGGALRLEWRAERLQTSLRATVGTEDLSFTDAASAARGVERVTSAASTKTVRFDSATIVNRMSGTVESAALRGRIQYSTAVDLESPFNVWPARGEIRVTGAGAAQLSVVAASGSSGTEARLGLDTNGDGSAESQSTSRWNDLLEGYLWWERGEFPELTTGEYRAYSSNEFRLAFSRVPNPFPVLTGAVVLQFSRPVTSLAQLQFVTQDSSQGRPTVAARVVADGARVTVTPDVQLEHGARYELRGAGAPFGDASGSTLSLPVVPPVVAANNLAAAIAPGPRISTARSALRLDGTGSTATDGAIRSYLWRQRSGTAAQIEDATAASTRLVPAAGGIAGERIDVELEVTNALDERDVERVTLYSIPSPLLVSALYLRGGANVVPPLRGQPYVVVTSETGTIATQRGAGQGVSVFYSEPVQGGTTQFYSLTFSGPGGAALAVGSYEGARAAGGAPGTSPTISISGNGSGCSETFGRFDVREIEYANDGAVTRLAIDFEQRCPLESSPVLSGSLRIRSDLPVREVP